MPSLLTPSATPSPLSSLADLLDPPDFSVGEVFEALDYEPICLPRHKAAEALGHANARVAIAVGDGHRLPPACGECPQELFHKATEFDVLYGGAAGGGKTRALVMDGIQDCVQYPGIRIGAFRRTFGELKESLLAELAKVGYAKPLGATWNGSEYELRFANSSLIMFRYAESLPDATRRQGGQYQKLIFDERTLTPPEVIQFLSTRLRSGRSEIPVLGIRSGTNPGGIGHGSVKARYIDATDHGKNVVTEANGRTVRFIQSKATDNPYLNVEYHTDLDALPESMRKAFRDGEWDSFSGQVFSEWRYDRHVIRPFTLPEGWTRFGGIDWGMRAPSAVLWAAEDQDRRLWVYDELYQTQLGEKGLAAAIKLKTGGEHVVFAFDPSMMNQTGDAMPSASILQQEGIPLKKANNDRLSGWQRVHTYLAEGPACNHHRALGWDTCPMVHVFDNCVELIRTLPAVPYNTTGKLEDVDTASEDHLPDAFRYLTMQLGSLSRPVFLDDETPATAPDGSPLLPVVPGGLMAGNTGTGLDFDQEDNGKVAVSPFA